MQVKRMRKYNVVIVGAGNIGAFFDNKESENILTHAHAFQQSEKFNLLGFYDISKERAQQAAKRWGVQAYETMEEAMQNAEVVCCTVPDEYHFDVLKEIAEYPVKFVFGEKPITKELEQAKEICQLYEKKNIPLQINYSRSFLKEFSQLKKEIENYGAFIKGCGHYVKGVLHSGSHMIDLIIKILGKIEAVQGGDKTYDFYEDDPSVEAKISVAGGKIYLHPIDFRVVAIFELDLFFEKARVRIWDNGNQIEIYPVLESPVYEGYYNYIKTETRQVSYNSALTNAVENIYEHLEHGKEMVCPMTKAKDVLEICCKLREWKD